jgi:two-component system phosphate regulon response regulator PhoB
MLRKYDKGDDASKNYDNIRRTLVNTMKNTTILIVEDEGPIRDMIRFALESADFEVIESENTKAAEQLIVQRIPDLILLDWMLPGTSGIQFTRQLKSNPNTRDIPIILLSAKAEEDNKIKGLETGADDYITKPFSPRELIARIRTVLRRGILITSTGVIRVDDLEINTLTHQVTIQNTLIELAPIEYKLLYFFLTHQNRVYTREQLLDHIWGGENYIDDRTVDVQIRRLRSRLKSHGYDSYIKTVHGTGYQFKGEVS